MTVIPNKSNGPEFCAKWQYDRSEEEIDAVPGESVRCPWCHDKLASGYHESDCPVRGPLERLYEAALDQGESNVQPKSDDPYLQRVVQTREGWFRVPDITRVTASTAIIDAYKAQAGDPIGDLSPLSLLQRALLWSGAYDPSALGEVAKGLSRIPRLREAVSRAVGAYATTDPGGMPLRRAETYLLALRSYGDVLDPPAPPPGVLRALLDESRATWLQCPGRDAETTRLLHRVTELGVVHGTDDLTYALDALELFSDDVAGKLGRAVAALDVLFDEKRSCWPSVSPGEATIMSARVACESYLRALRNYGVAVPECDAKAAALIAGGVGMAGGFAEKPEAAPQEGRRLPSASGDFDPLLRELCRSLYAWNDVLVSVAARVEKWLPHGLIGCGWLRDDADHAIDTWQKLHPWVLGSALCVFLARRPQIDPAFVYDHERDFGDDHDARTAAPLAWARLVAMQAYGRDLLNEGILEEAEKRAPKPAPAPAPAVDRPPTPADGLDLLRARVRSAHAAWLALPSETRRKARAAVRYAIHAVDPNHDDLVVAPLSIDVPLTDAGIGTLAHNLGWVDWTELGIGSTDDSTCVGLRLVTALCDYHLEWRRVEEARPKSAVELHYSHQAVEQNWTQLTKAERENALLILAEAFGSAGATPDEIEKCCDLLEGILIPEQEQARMIAPIAAIDSAILDGYEETSPAALAVAVLRAFRKVAIALVAEKQPEPAAVLRHRVERARSAWGRAEEVEAYGAVAADAAALLRAAWVYGATLAHVDVPIPIPVEAIKAELRARRTSGQEPGNLKSMLRLGQAFVAWWGRSTEERQCCVDRMFGCFKLNGFSPWGSAVRRLLQWPSGLGVVGEHEAVCAALAEHDPHVAVWNKSMDAGDADCLSATNTAAERLVRAAVKYGRALRHRESHEAKKHASPANVSVVRGLARAFGTEVAVGEACASLVALRAAFHWWSCISEPDREGVRLAVQGARHSAIYYAAHHLLATPGSDASAVAAAAVAYARATGARAGETPTFPSSVDGPLITATRARAVLEAAWAFGRLYLGASA